MRMLNGKVRLRSDITLRAVNTTTPPPFRPKTKQTARKATSCRPNIYTASGLVAVVALLRFAFAFVRCATLAGVLLLEKLNAFARSAAGRNVVRPNGGCLHTECGMRVRLLCRALVFVCLWYLVQMIMFARWHTLAGVNIALFLQNFVHYLCVCVYICMAMNGCHHQMCGKYIMGNYDVNDVENNRLVFAHHTHTHFGHSVWSYESELLALYIYTSHRWGSSMQLTHICCILAKSLWSLCVWVASTSRILWYANCG